MKAEEKHTPEESVTLSEKQLSDLCYSSMDYKFLRELIDYRETHLENCEETRNKFVFLRNNFVAILTFTILSLIPTSPLYWLQLAFFGVGALISFKLYSKMSTARTYYDANRSMHNYSEELIEYGKKTLYGIGYEKMCL